MAKISLFAVLEVILGLIAGFLLIYGNILAIGGISPTEIVPMLVLTLGFALSVFYFLLALLVTVTNLDDSDNKDMIAANMFAAPLLLGNIFTIGSFFDTLPSTQSVILDIGLIIGTFFIFCTFYVKLKDKWDFLEIDDIDIIAGTDKEKYPKFFLSAIILGIIYVIPFIIFKIWFLNYGYNSTAYLFLGVIFLYALIMSFGHEIVAFIKTKILRRV